MRSESLHLHNDKKRKYSTKISRKLADRCILMAHLEYLKLKDFQIRLKYLHRDNTLKLAQLSPLIIEFDKVYKIDI